MYSQSLDMTQRKVFVSVVIVLWRENIEDYYETLRLLVVCVLDCGRSAAETPLSRG